MRRGGRSPCRLGAAGLCCSAVSVALILITAALGPSAAEATFGPGHGPPWFGAAKPRAVPVLILVVAAIAVGAFGVWLTLRALRAGWSVSPRRLFAAGALATCALLVVPPITSTDVLNYAAYGRIVALGHNPYVETPAQLARSHDPIGRAATRQTPYGHITTVYGPVATGFEALAAELGGRSLRRVVWWLSVETAVAFLATGGLLYKLAGDRRARARSQLLWTANPLLLLQLVAAAHTDVIAIAFGVAGLLLLRRSSVGAGMASGIAAATKATAGAFAVGLVWAERRRPVRLVPIAAGIAVAVVAAAVASGSHGLHALSERSRGATRAAPWHLIGRLLALPLPGHTGTRIALVGSLLSFGALVWLLARGLPVARGRDETGRAIRATLVVTTAWTFTGLYYLPWYDAMVWALLALVAATWLDSLVVLHTAVLSIAYAPGAPVLSPPALQSFMQHAVRSDTVPAILLGLLVVLVVGTRRHGRAPHAAAWRGARATAGWRDNLGDEQGSSADVVRGRRV